MKTWRRRVYEWIEPGEQSSPVERVVDWAVLGLIVVSVLVVMLLSMPEMEESFGALLAVERAIVGLFTLEYLIRLWTSPERASDGEGIGARLRYALRPMSLVDLASILPFYLEPLAGANTVVFRLLRVFRLVRVLKLGRYHAPMGLLLKVLLARRAELMVSLALVLSLVVITSTLMYAVEHDAQPKAFASIPASMWWGVVTLTTVGYGDVYPVTPLGKLIAGCAVILGLGLFALPAGILASGFHEELARMRQQTELGQRCPHCGQNLPER